MPYHLDLNKNLKLLKLFAFLFCLIFANGEVIWKKEKIIWD